MRKSLTALVAAATFAAAALAIPKPAEARCWGCWAGAGIAAGIIGGAIIASSRAYAYGYPRYYGHGYAPYAYAPAYAYRRAYAYGYGPRVYRPYYVPRRVVYGPRVYRSRYYVAPRLYRARYAAHRAHVYARGHYYR